MEVTSSGMYQSNNLDLCSGHSGSGVMTADASRYVVAIVSGECGAEGHVLGSVGVQDKVAPHPSKREHNVNDV